MDKLIETNSKENKLIHTEVVDTKEEVRVLKKFIKKNKNEPSAEPSNLPSLPVRNTDEHKNLEEILQDENEMQNLVKKLSNYGGSQLRNTICNIMKNFLTSHVEVLYSMQGKNKKLPFLDLKLCKSIQGM